MNRILVLGSLLLLSSCRPLMVMSDAPPEPPVVVHPDVASAPIASQPSLTPLSVIQPAPDIVEIVPTPAAYVSPLPTSKPFVAPPRPVASPLQLVQEGQQGAQIRPGDVGYRQVGTMHYYAYAEGRAYVVYLSPRMATGLLFPEGDVIKKGLFLPKEEFTAVEVPGAGKASYDAITIHPAVDKGEYDAFVLMQNGRVYTFHFIVGKQAMLTVSFDVPVLEAQR